MRKDLERASKDRETEVVGKQKVEERLKEVTRARDELEKASRQQCKDLEVRKKKYDELLT